MIQWARRKLKDKGYLDKSAPCGIWRLSKKGIIEAHRNCKHKTEW